MAYEQKSWQDKVTEEFGNMLEKIHQDDAGKYDFTTNLRDIDFNDSNGRFVMKNNNGDEMEYDLTTNAYNQIMSKVGIPAQYARKLPFHLLKTNFDYWKKKIGEKEMFIRAKKLNEENDLVRAFLSPKYNVLDNKHVVDAFTKNISRDKYICTNYNITDDMFNARIILKDFEYNNVSGPDGKPNKFFAGLHITNGETGNYSVNIDMIIWELWCQNGAIRRFGGKSILSKKHSGNDFSLVEKFNEALSEAKDNAGETMELFVNAKTEEVKQPIITLTQLMARRKEIFRDNFRQAVIDAYEQRPEPTRYGIISALTQAAQQLPYDRRIEVEKVAGDIMTKAIRI